MQKPDLRVLAVIPGDGNGQNFIFARRQVESLASIGVHVNVFYLKSRTAPSYWLRDWSRLRRSIIEFSPDIVHAHYGTATSFLCALATTCPLVITFRGSDLNRVPDNSLLRNCIALLLSQLSALKASAIFCTSGRLRGRLWWKKKITEVVPSGVNVNLFKPIDKQMARRILGWKDDERVLLFNRAKNPLLKGLSLVERAVSRAEMQVGIIRFVQLDGRVPPEKMPIYLNAADCLAIASEFEGSPNILKEALACNLPVVSVDVGDVAERLVGVVPSRVVPRDADCFGQAICEILKAPRRSNGREKVLRYSEDQIAARICYVYEAVYQSR